MENKPNPKNQTPEERLFKIIQEGEKKDALSNTLYTPQPQRAENKPKAASPLEEVPSDIGVHVEEKPAAAENVVLNEHEMNLKRALRASRQNLFESSAVKKVLSIRTANHALLAILFIMTAYFAASQFAAPHFKEDFLDRAKVTGVVPLEVPKNLFSVVIPKGALPQRNIFQPWSESREAAKVEAAAAVAATEAAGSEMSPQIAGVINNLRVSGVYEGDDPEALIEVIDETRTYIVKAGTLIKGIKVKEVKKDGVVLTDGKSEQFLQIK